MGIYEFFNNVFMPKFMLGADLVSSWLLPITFFLIVSYGYYKKVKVYETFVEGAKEGFNTAVMVMPYLVVMLAGIAIFRAGGVMGYFADVMNLIIPAKYLPSDIILLALVKPLSGSAARGVMLEIFQQYGPDSFRGFLASCVQGSTETTFYVIAVYLGAVGITKSRHIVVAGLSAELVAVTISTFIANLIYAGK